MSYALAQCPICKYNALTQSGGYQPINDNLVKVVCLRCGEFMIAQHAIIALPEYIPVEKRLQLSSHINEITHNRYLITYDEMKRLAGVLKIPSVDERANRILLFIAENYPKINTGPNWQDIGNVFHKGTNFDEIDLSNSTFGFTMQMLSKSWCEDQRELVYLIFEYLKDTQKYIKESGDSELIITPAGWSKIDELKTVYHESNIAFIAMKFNPNLIKYSKTWFEPAITEAGYDCKVMYSHKHTKVIDNEMKALIRRSKFVVCDLTENSRGAYYEAGFAHGLGVPVIFLCESKFFHKKEHELGPESPGVHFDTNHYPFIEWKWDKGEALQKELKDWIEATIGRGLNNKK